MARRIRRSVTVVIVLAIAGAAIVFGPELWHRYGDRLFSTNLCTATVDGESSGLTAEQANNAALIVAVGTSRGLPEQAKTIALATALQESDLRNLRIGDRDSLGLFQQRPSQGWGTAEQVMNPHHATNAFYDALILVDGWESMSITEAAQAVQRSGFPGAYADHEADAVLWSAALSGQAGMDAMSCSLDAVSPSPTPVEALQERLGSDFGSIVDMSAGAASDGRVNVTVRADPSLQGAVYAWAIAVASTQAIEEVGWCGYDWIRDRRGLDPSADFYRPANCLPGEVEIILDVN
jgi:hypothetical protein